MKILLTVLIFSAAVIFSCSGDSVQDPNVITEDYSSILYTDVFGNILGGDLTDWCKDTCTNVIYPCNSFSPAYPNPVNDTLNLRFSIKDDSSKVKLYFLNSSADTVFLINDVMNSGYYILQTTETSLSYSGVYKRVYIKINDFSCYGDIKFN